MEKCLYCNFTWSHYLVLRKILLPHLAQTIHRILCTEVVDASAEILDERIRSGKPTMLLLCNIYCRYSASFEPVYQEFARLSSFRALRFHLNALNTFDTPLLKSLDPHFTPTIIGFAHGHIIRNPTKYKNRNLNYLLEFANRLQKLNAPFDKTKPLQLRTISNWNEDDDEIEGHWIVENKN
jgi:hypothetical protein